MTPEEFMSVFLREFVTRSKHTMVRRELVRQSVTVARNPQGLADARRRLEKRTLEYMRTEEAGGPDGHDFHFRFWRGVKIAGCTWLVWRYRSPHRASATRDLAVAYACVHGRNTLLGLTVLPKGAEDDFGLLWVVAQDLWSRGHEVVYVRGAWRVYSELQLALASQGKAEHGAIPADGLPDLAKLRKRDRIDPRATRSDIGPYEKKLSWEVSLFSKLNVRFERIGAAVACPFGASEIAACVKDQNTFTMPEGADGRVDARPGHVLGGVKVSHDPVFLSDAHVGSLRVWLWGFVDRVGNDCYLAGWVSDIAQRTPRGMKVFTGFSALTVDQMIARVYCGYLERESLRLKRLRGRWVEGIAAPSNC